MTTRTLSDVIATLPRLKPSDVVYAKRPFRPESDAALVSQSLPGAGPPDEIKRDGYHYFLEVPVMNEVLEAIPARLNTPENRVAVLIHYAEFDTWPEWLDERAETRAPRGRRSTATARAKAAPAPKKGDLAFPLERAASVSDATLLDVIERFDDLRSNDVIYAMRPFTASSRAVVVPIDERLSLPRHIKEAGFTCFIRQPDAVEALESLPPPLDTAANRARLLIHVVTHGRYPDWIR